MAWGVMAIQCGNRIRNVHFSHIRIEDVVSSSLYNLQICFSSKYNRAPGNSIRDVYFDHISYVGDPAHMGPNTLLDYDEEHTVRRVFFDGVEVSAPVGR